MDFDKPKVYGDTSITDGLVSMTVVQGTINCASLLTGSRSKEEMGGIARARDKDIILKSIAFVCRGDPNASLLLTNARRQFFAIVYYINMLCMQQISKRHHLQLSDALASTFLIASVA